MSQILTKMKRKSLGIIIILLVVAIASTGFSSSNDVDLSQYIITDEICFYNVPNENEVVSKEATDPFQLFLGKSYVGFREALGFKESRGNYSIINEYGYMGKYQFGRSTLKMIGIYSSKEFIGNTELQEEAFSAYVSRNKWILRRDIKRFEGTYIRGVKITESGMLAAAHLGGAGNVKKYLRSGGMNGFEDAFGTSIGYYLKKFSGYDTSFVVADKMAKATI